MSVIEDKFVHLHIHTEYSLLDGANRIKDLIKHVKDLGMDSVAITDHGVMYGVVDFYKEAVKSGIKPILGCEVYTARRSRFDKQSGIDSEQGHLVLLAKNNTGYKNLMKIVSLGFTEGFYYKPRIDYEVLETHSEGLIALSACLGGDVPAALYNGEYEKAKRIATRYNNIFGQGNFYLELQINGIEEQISVNQKLIELSDETGIPLIATNDAHYLRKQDSRAHEILLCIQTGKSVNDENRMRFRTDEFYVKSPAEMAELFRHVPSSIENTLKVAEMCDVKLDFNKVYLPIFDTPDDKDSFKYLKELCYAGLKSLYRENCDHLKIKRLEYELSVIKKMGYVDYILIVWDFIKYAKDNGIMVGPGRGSAAGSVVCYCLGITNVDPIKYSLLFERFLNPERISMPDIDIDFCFERRQEVIDYVIEKYGKDRVAQIITFGTMAARGAVRDVGRALDIPYGDVDRIAKMIPFQIGMNIEKALLMNPDIKAIYDEDIVIAELIDTAKMLEGMPRHASTHAAGVVISDAPVIEHVPVQKNDESITTQFTMGLLEELGLLKMDFLGLRTLTVIRDAVELINKNYNIKVDIDKLNMDDKAVFKLISDGKTAGVFQLESEGMKQFMRELVPSSLEDIIAGISLYRPGPMDHIPRYIKNKNNPGEIKYHHKLLENILDVTYGCMVYQEQVMQIVRDLAGYSMGRSDLVRRAMSKKKLNVMEEERQNFLNGIVDKEGNIVADGTLRNGIDEVTSNKIFDEMIDFASYAFNKSHAAAYAVITYQTAWLKCHYPDLFMAALLNSFVGSSDKISFYINECKLLHIEVLPPDINESDLKFTVVNKKIRFGMAAIKNVGENAIKSIIAERDANGRFKSFNDFCGRVDGQSTNKRCIESLIKSGAFDSMGIYRSKLLAVFERMIDGVLQSRKRKMEGQISLFETSGNTAVNDNLQEGLGDIYPDIKEYPKKVLLSMEREILGLYVSGHPLDECGSELASSITHYSYDFTQNASEDEGGVHLESQLKNFRDGMNVVVGGIITSKKTKTTKNNNLIAFLNLEDLYGALEIIVFPSILQKFGKFIDEENIVIIKGRISMREEEQPKIICDEVLPLIKSVTGKLYLKIKSVLDKEFIASIVSLLKSFNGNTPVYFYFDNEKETRVSGKDCWVNLSEDVITKLKEKLGENNVKVV